MKDKWARLQKEWVEWFSPLKQIYVENQRLFDWALLYAILLILVYITLVGFLEIPEESVTAVGQLFADWLLFPIVIIGFYIAVKEYRKSQIVLELEIFWTGDAGVIVDEEGTYILFGSPTYATSFRLFLHVVNSGELISIWYRISVDVPTELFKLFERIERDEQDKIKSGIYELRWHPKDDASLDDNITLERNQYGFNSNGQYAIYPGQSFHIATVEVTIPPNYLSSPRQGQIDYSIVTDKTKLVSKKQIIKIQTEMPDLADSWEEIFSE